MRNEREHRYTSEDEIKDFLNPIKSHKKAFVIFTFISVIFTVFYLYTAERVYKTDAKIEIIPTQPSSKEEVSISSTGKTNIETEIDKILSRKLVKESLERLGEKVRYFEKKFLKEVELYKDSPFKVIVEKIKNQEAFNFKFEIQPIDKNSFELKVSRGFLQKIKGYKKYPFEKIYKFGELINLGFAEIKVEKIRDFKGKYTFEFVNIDSYTDSVISRLDVSRTSKYSNVLEISYEDNVPQRAKDFVDNLIYSYIEDSAKGRTKEIKQRLKFINTQLDIVSKNLKKYETLLEQFKKKNKIIDISSEAKVTIQKLSEFDKQYAQLSIEDRILRDVYKQVVSEENKNINLYGIKDPVLNSLVQEYNKLVAKRNALLTEYTEYHPDVEKVNAQLEKIKRNIEVSVFNLKKEVRDRLIGTRAVIGKYESFLRSLPEKEKEYIRIKRNYAVNEKIYSYLVQKKLEASLAEISALAGVRIIDEASLPKAPIKPKKNIILLLGALIGFVFGTAYGYIRDLFEDKVKYLKEVERLINAPIVGIVPHLKKKDIKNILSRINNGKLLRIFRILKANIQLLFKETKKSQVILITSPEEEDGKAFISSNLGATYALSSSSKVVVVDLNFFDPKLHIYYNNISNEAGILDILKKDSYEDKELEKLIEKNVLEKEILNAVFNVIKQEKSREGVDRFDLEEIEGILDTVIRRIFKEYSDIDEIVENIYEKVEEVVYNLSDKRLARRLYIRITNAISSTKRIFSREKILSVEKEKIFRAQIKYSIKKVPEIENLYVITAGHLDKEDALFSKKLILTSELLKNIIKELKKEFKHIILNAPSVQSVPEVFMLMKEADISLLVFRTEKTRKTMIKEIDRKIAEMGLSKVGVVVNDVKEDKIEEILG